MLLKKIILFSVLVLLSVGLFTLNPNQAEATGCQPSTVRGWAWSSNIGWVSFSCVDRFAIGAGINYGVNIAGNGMMSGFAWSDTVGWISFNLADLAGCPHGTCNAVLANNNLSGWARALTTGEWISLAGSIGGGGTYGVQLVSPEFRGWAWGDQIVGWLSWNCIDRAWCATSTYAVALISTNSSPQATNATSTVRFCDHFVSPQVATGTTVVLGWTYSDPEGIAQDRYEIQVSTDVNFSTIIHNPVVISSISQHSLNHPLAWNTTYHWRVRVFDGVNWSGWLTSQFTIGRLHASPLAVFSYSPQRITTNEVTRFNAWRTISGVTTTSRTYDGSVPRFDWTFGGGTPATSTSASTTTTTFGTIGARVATLRVTETGPTGYWCEWTENLNIAVPLPDWREITPFGRARIFLADIVQRVWSLVVHFNMTELLSNK